MREIKFKAFIHETGKIEEVSSISFVDGEVFFIHIGILEKTYFTYNGGFTLLQYTGLKDKNGREIYEGDIIEIKHIEDEETTVHQVVWGGNEYPAWDVTPYWDSECNVFSDIACSGYYEMRVIGNIYEHSHLLEGKG